VLAKFSWKIAEVQTANANIPAVSLYKKHGFLEIKSWPSKEGIELILLSKDKSAT
jgi:ribosomal protein S18 acetylase RimI-like enzyme